MASFIEVIIEPTNLLLAPFGQKIKVVFQSVVAYSFLVSSTRSGLMLEHKDSLFEHLAKTRGVYTVALKVMSKHALTSGYMTFNCSE